MHAIESVVGMNRIIGLQGGASLLESKGEEGDGLGDAVDFEAFTGYFAADGIEDQRQPETGSCDADYGSDGICNAD